MQRSWVRLPLQVEIPVSFEIKIEIDIIRGIDAHTWILIDDLTEGPVDTLDMATSLAETCIDVSLPRLITRLLRSRQCL